MVFMADFFKMWKAHVDNSEKFSALDEIKDDNGDGVPEVNRPAEVRALLKEVGNYLKSLGKLSKRDRVVLVKDAAYTEDGEHWRKLDHFPWEATPYASVFKFSHDIYPAKAALGTKGCTDCHSFGSLFFNRPVLVDLWDAQGKLHFEPNYKLLGYSKLAVDAGAFRQEILEPVLYYGIVVVFILLGLWVAFCGLRLDLEALSLIPAWPTGRLMLLILIVAVFGPAINVVLGKFISSDVLGYLAFIHKVAGVLGLLAALYLLVSRDEKGLAFALGIILMLYQAVTGGALLLSNNGNLRQVVFTLHDLGALAAVVLAGVVILWRSLRGKGSEEI